MKQRLTVLQYIRKCSLLKIWYPVSLILFIFVLVYFLPLREQLFPAALSAEDSLTGCYEQGHTYVIQTVDELYYTGCDYYVNGELRGHYYYTLDSELLRVQFYILPSQMGQPAEAHRTQTTLRGKLLPMDSAFSPLTDSLAASLGWTGSGLAEISETVMLSNVDYWKPSMLVLYAVLAVLLLLSVFISLRHLLYIICPRLSPAYRRLHKYGKPSVIIREVDRELREECLVLTKDMALLSDYLIEFSEDISVIVPLKNILWVYEHATLKQSSAFKRLSYTLHIVMEDGDSFVFNHKLKEDIDIIIEELSLRYPNFFYGYSDEHYRMVKHILKENRKEKR